MKQPLAYRMRPVHIDEVIGQSHLVGENKIIRRMVDAFFHDIVWPTGNR